MSESLGTWIDGVAGDVVPADDRGLQYGDGLFETILVRANRPRFLDAHLARLARGCSRLGIRFRRLATRCAPKSRHRKRRRRALAILKIIITRGSARRRGYAPIGRRSRAPYRVVRGAGLDAGARRDRVSHCGSLDCGWPITPALAGIKHLNRLENVLAAAEDPGADPSSRCCSIRAGSVVSGTMSNVFIVRAGVLVTPPVDRAGVAGVMRGDRAARGAAPGHCRDATGSLTLDELLARRRGVHHECAHRGCAGAKCRRAFFRHESGIAARLRAHIEALDA